MPDSSGRIRGTGWSRRAEAAFDRLRSNAASPPYSKIDIQGAPIQQSGIAAFADVVSAEQRALLPSRREQLLGVPTQPPPEVETWLADRSDAEDNWPVDAYDQRRSAWRTCD